MEVRQALADIAEVRDRLAIVQRFGGYSGWASIASGLVAIAAGAVQGAVAPQPRGLDGQRAYLDIWLWCLVAALAINYGAILIWRTHNRGTQAGVQVRTVGMSILPAIAAGGERAYRVWRLYMAGSAQGFRSGRMGVFQALLAKPHADGSADVAPTRRELCAG